MSTLGSWQSVRSQIIVGAVLTPRPHLRLLSERLEYELEGFKTVFVVGERSCNTGNGAERLFCRSRHGCEDERSAGGSSFSGNAGRHASSYTYRRLQSSTRVSGIAGKSVGVSFERDVVGLSQWNFH